MIDVVPRHALAGAVHVGQRVLRGGIALVGENAEPMGGFDRIAPSAQTFRGGQTDVVARLGFARNVEHQAKRREIRDHTDLRHRSIPPVSVAKPDASEIDWEFLPHSAMPSLTDD
ncbi:MAG TPA: hypothetical protein VL742_00820 [Casimicrobiaceae bacterium]|nr:hypothetical protein [Casimicrobiaceae bacterium]